MAASKWTYVGPWDEVVVPGVGLVKNGESVEFPAELSDTLNPELWEVGSKKASKKAAVDTPKGEEVTA